MHRLSPAAQDGNRIKSMKNVYSADRNQQSAGPPTSETTAGTGSEQLEVNVIFTEKQATAAALKSAESFASGLGACIRLRAVIAVPFRLSLDQPPVSVCFMEQLLCNLADHREENGAGCTVLYVCRDQIETILLVLRPNSLVVIGGRKRWWPTATSRIAGALHAKGHRVGFVDAKRQTAESLQ